MHEWVHEWGHPQSRTDKVDYGCPSSSTLIYQKVMGVIANRSLWVSPFISHLSPQSEFMGVPIYHPHLSEFMGVPIYLLPIYLHLSPHLSGGIGPVVQNANGGIALLHGEGIGFFAV